MRGPGGCRSIDNVGEYERIEVAGERVDSVVQEDVLLMKLDVEGFEPTAFQSSKGILDSFRCPCLLVSGATSQCCSPLKQELMYVSSWRSLRRMPPGMHAL